MNVSRAEHALGQRHLQRHVAAEQSVPGADHEPEPARPEVVQDLESAQERTIVIVRLACEDSSHHRLVLVDLRGREHLEQKAQAVSAPVLGRSRRARSRRRATTRRRRSPAPARPRSTRRLSMPSEVMGPAPAVRAAWRSLARTASGRNRPRSRASSQSPHTTSWSRAASG